MKLTTTHLADALGSSIGIDLRELASRLDFPALLGQRTRLLQIETALPSTALLVERLSGREAINEPFAFDLTCLSTSAHLELKQLIGEQVSVRLLRADGGWRVWHGYVTQASNLGADGGLARFGLRLESWLAFLALRRDSYIFQDRHALDVIEAVFADHPQANWRVAASPETVAALRVRETCTQYDESDLDFVLRLLAEEGLSYHFEHEDAPDLHIADPADSAAAPPATAARHCLVITDALSARSDIGTLRYSRPDLRQAGGLVSDTLTQFGPTRRVRPTAVTLGRWLPHRLSGATGQHEVQPAETLPPLEVYASASHGAPSLADDHTQSHAQTRLNALRLSALSYAGSGAVRTLAAGSQFTLAAHPTLSGQRYTVLAVEHHAANNLGSQAARLLGLPQMDAHPSGGYQQHLQAVDADTPIAPLPRPKPAVSGVQLARVVGVAGEAVTTDRDLRVKIQYPWQRGTSPLAGGLSDTGSRAANTEANADSSGNASPPADPGNAPGNEQSGFWVRVAQPSAGADWGSVFVPRNGTEVLVAYADGDIDAPVIVGQLHTPDDPPPWPAGAHADRYGGANHPSTLSGVRSAWLDGQGHNEWLIDDHSGQLRMRLRAQGAGIADGELALGHLIQQTTSAQRGPWLGAGFYAQTDGWAIVRAERGLLLSTSSRHAHGSSVSSTQMDAAEAVGLMRAARQLGRQLSDGAAHQQALKLASHDDQQALAQHIAAIDPAQDGQHGQALNGQVARQAVPGSREPGAPVEAFATPLVHLDAAASLAWSSAGPISSFSGQDFSLTAHGDIHQAAAHTYSSVSGGTTSWFTHDGGIHLVAAAGPLSIRALTGAQDLLAQQGLTVTSSSDEVVIQAAQRIELSAGNCQVLLDGADITFKAPGSFTVKAASHDWGGPGGQAAVLPNLPTGMAQVPPNDLLVVHRYHDEESVQGARYEARLSDGSTRRGSTDAAGQVQLRGVPPGPVTIRFEPDGRAFERRDTTANDRAGSVDELIQRYSSSRGGQA